jgi:hypothetical protein
MSNVPFSERLVLIDTGGWEREDVESFHNMLQTAISQSRRRYREGIRLWLFWFSPAPADHDTEIFINEFPRLEIVAADMPHPLKNRLPRSRPNKAARGDSTGAEEDERNEGHGRDGAFLDDDTDLGWQGDTAHDTSHQDDLEGGLLRRGSQHGHTAFGSMMAAIRSAKLKIEKITASLIFWR